MDVTLSFILMWFSFIMIFVAAGTGIFATRLQTKRQDELNYRLADIELPKQISYRRN